jgi:TonB family protein
LLKAAPLPPPIRLVGRNVLPNTDNYYPASEIRAEHEGSAEVQSCVDVNGRLDGLPTIQASSGRAPLDTAAIRLARDGKYARAMRGDTPVANCYRFRVTFTLH